MGFRRSRRSGSHVIFHCPACFADRVGLVRRGRWQAWPDGRPDRDQYLVCTGCGNQIHPCNVIDSPTADAFSTRLFGGARSLIASVVAAGRPTEEVYDAAIDAVETVTPLRYSPAQLDEDLGAPDLANRLRGDLILLAEQLRPHGAEALLRQAVRIASIGGGPTPAQRAVIGDAAGYLGVGSFEASA